MSEAAPALQGGSVSATADVAVDVASAPANADASAGAAAGAGTGAGAGAGAGAGNGAGAGAGGASATSTPTTRTMNDVLEAGTPWYRSLANVSNLATFLVFVIGLVLVLVDSDFVLGKYVLSVGLFGFAGGSTNWLAVKMLFDRIPLLYGSGVIPNKFREIRQTVKDAIMLTFFDPAFLQGYVAENAPKLLDKLDLKGRMAQELAKPEVDAMIVAKLNEAASKGDANAQMLMMLAGLMGGSFDALVPKIKPVLVSFGQELVVRLSSRFRDGSFVDIEALRGQIDALMTDKLRLLTPEMVKKLMEDVMRKHLGWLVLWGNVFGGLIGLISQAVGFGV